jgi:hypothetical protein
MNVKPHFFMLAVFVISSCGGSKSVNGSSKVNPSLSVKNIVSAHDAASPDFSTLAARIQVEYEEEKKQQSITISLRMKKDETIWIKASLLGITLSKLILTPDRVSYYETLGKTYFDGDFSLLSEWLGTEIDFDKAQSILLGQSIFKMNSSKYSKRIIQNSYQLYPKQQPENFIHYLFLNPQNFKVASGSLSQPNNNRLLSIRYGDYQKMDNDFYPTTIVIIATENESNKRFNLNYKKIDLNLSVNFPFRIPNGYKEIQL